MNKNVDLFKNIDQYSGRPVTDFNYSSVIKNLIKFPFILFLELDANLQWRTIIKSLQSQFP